MRVSPFQRLSIRTILLLFLLPILFVISIVYFTPLSDEVKRNDRAVSRIVTIERHQQFVISNENTHQPTAGRSVALQLSEFQTRQKNSQSDDLIIPPFESILPHLHNNPNALHPSLVYANDSRRSNIRLVIGIPTVPRDKQSYLLETLQSLAFGLSDEQQKTTVFVISIGSLEGANTESVRQQIALIEADFKEYLNNGLFRIIVPSPEWYPSNLKSIEPNLGDSPQRMFWRTKQNLDYMFLMTYSYPLGEYYLQVEDDVLAKSGYIDGIEKFIREKKEKNWFTIDFASLGFIGKLFHTYDLPYMIHYIALLYRFKPVDWILDTIFIDRYCEPFSKPKPCSKLWANYRLRGTTLFQHVGIHSSLEGKVQELKEANFGQSNSFNAHMDNPSAVVTTNLQQYEGYGIQLLYDGTSLFWSSVSPVEGDYIAINFTETTLVKGFLIRSGNAEHPNDRFNSSTIVMCKNATEGSHFEQITTFNDRGVARHDFDVPQSLKAIRIEIHANYNNWLLLSELHIKR